MKSWQIITSYSDPRIRVFKNEAFMSGAPVRNIISKIETGEYIAIHHSDDVWEPQKLERQVAFLDEHPDVGAVFTWAQIIDEHGLPFMEELHFYYKIFDQPNRTRFEWLNYFFYYGNALCHPSVLIRRQCYDNCGFYRYGLAQLGDFDMWVRLCLKHEIYVIPEKYVRFRVRINELNTSGNRPDTRIRWYFEVLQVLNNYRNISSRQELVKVFPNAEKYLRQQGYDLDFALGMVALDLKTNQITELFGLNILFEIINEPGRLKKIGEFYDFTYKDFLTLTGQYDIFSVELMLTLSRQIAEQKTRIAEQEMMMAKDEQQIELLNVKVAERDRDLMNIRNSKAWKFVIQLRRIRDIVAPINSHRAIILRQSVIFFVSLFEKMKKNYKLKREAALVRASGLFDEAWYLSNNADIINSKIPPLHHYLLFGGLEERRDPNPYFSSGWYLDTYKDVKDFGKNPLVHYLEFGRKEGRATKPDR